MRSRVLDRRLATLDPVPRRAAPARQHCSRAAAPSGRAARARASRPSWCSTGARSAAGQLRAGRIVAAGRASTTDPRKRPFIVVDPRAGHGPGIGGMKQDSEIGVALAAGHPCYFVGFLPEPVPGPDDRGRVQRRGGVRRGGRPAPPAGRRQAGADRQLPGRLADHDDGGDPARARRADPARRLAAVLLGGRARQEPACAISAACSAAPG